MSNRFCHNNVLVRIPQVTGFEKWGHFAHFPNFQIWQRITNYNSYGHECWWLDTYYVDTMLAGNTELRPLPVWVWQAATSVDVENCRFAPQFEALPLEPGKVPRLCTLNVRSARPELFTNQELKQKPLLSWNGDTLKNQNFVFYTKYHLLSNLVFKSKILNISYWNVIKKKQCRVGLSMLTFNT